MVYNLHCRLKLSLIEYYQNNNTVTKNLMHITKNKLNYKLFMNLIH